MLTFQEDGQACLFDQDICVGKMCPAHSPAEKSKAKTSGLSSKKLSELSSIPFMSLDLSRDAGNLLGEYYWEIHSPYVGEHLILNTGPAPRNVENVSSLSQILEANPPRKYYLTKKACLGILRRSEERGKQLPPQLELALKLQAGLIPIDKFKLGANTPVGVDGYNADITGQVSSTLGINCGMSTGRNGVMVAGFLAHSPATAATVGYQEECSPTLRAKDTAPEVLCINDQGGQYMHLSKNITGTLRSQMSGHPPLVLESNQNHAAIRDDGICPTLPASMGMGGGYVPMVYENHGIDSRYTGPHDVVPTISARCGTGGNNVPLVEQPDEIFCIVGNIIDRQPENGGNGLGCQRDIAYTLTGTDRHAVFSRQRVDVFQENEVFSTESARQYKDATDLIVQACEEDADEEYDESSAPVVLLIRRLTPLECERLQGFPDYWTKIPGASDSARYKAIGNSVAIPCVDYVINGMAVVLRNQNKQHKEKFTYENTNCMQNFGSDTPVLYPAETGQ